MQKFLKSRNIILTLPLMGLLALSGCDTMRNTLGLDHYQPDEFQISENPPLSMPKDYSLRPPSENTPATSVQPVNVATQKAEVALMGKAAPAKVVSTDNNAQGLVNQAAAGKSVDPNIREEVNKEAASEPKSTLEAKLAEIKKNATTLENKPVPGGEDNKKVS
ncbi:DUF3035 domain-containing protein [Candidatus Finniella inopinata]|nr:DUF3035 domain-containing protein [Candidatus Finniella inopinata]